MTVYRERRNYNIDHKIQYTEFILRKPWERMDLGQDLEKERDTL